MRYLSLPGGSTEKDASRALVSTEQPPFLAKMATELYYRETSRENHMVTQASKTAVIHSRTW